jgi:hypothetical protein
MVKSFYKILKEFESPDILTLDDLIELKPFPTRILILPTGEIMDITESTHLVEINKYKSSHKKNGFIAITSGHRKDLITAYNIGEPPTKANKTLEDYLLFFKIFYPKGEFNYTSKKNLMFYST